jgi:iron complex outermembrane receptor protein
MRKTALLKQAIFILLSFFSLSVLAQSGKIKGKVTGKAGALSGASVSTGSKGTATNTAGEFEISVKPGTYTVTASYVGYKNAEQTVTVKTGETVQVDIVLEEGTSEAQEVVLVGSRVGTGRSKLSTPVPVDVISPKEFKGFAQMDLTQALNYIAPSFNSQRTTIADGTDHIDPASLRGLGPDQVLVLVNGKRRHNTALVNINGTVGRGSVGTDLNAIPAAAIERIEVLRDGAAAQYGSDAIAGVINIVLKKNWTGTNASVTFGEHNTYMPYAGQDLHYKDGRNIQVDFTKGMKFLGKGTLTLSGQYLERDRTNRSGLDNSPLIYYGTPGSINFNPPPSAIGLTAADYRRYLMDLDNLAIAERKYNRRNLIVGNSYSRNYTFFANGSLPLSTKTEFYFTAGFGHRLGDAAGNYRTPNARNQQPVNLDGSLVYPDGFLPFISSTIDDRSLLLGTKSSLGKWGFEVSNVIGENSYRFDVLNSGNSSIGPDANNFNQKDFYAGKLRFLQNTTNVDLNRKFDNAGVFNYLNVAFGAEGRFERYEIMAGEPASYIGGTRTTATVAPTPVPPPYTNNAPTGTTATVPGAQVFPGYSPADQVDRKRYIAAVYGDVEAKYGLLTVGVAGRFEQYMDMVSPARRAELRAKGIGVSNYNGLGGKLALRYDFTNKFAVRASASRGFRAPSLHQRLFQNTSTQFISGLPSQALTANNENPIVRGAFGIGELSPETSYGFTLGFVGNYGNGLSVTLDGYYILIKDRIVLSTQFTRSNPLVNAILNANGVSSSINGLQFWTNAADTRTLGADLVIAKKFKMRKGIATVTFAANYNNNKVTNINTNSKIDLPVNNPSLSDPQNNNPANDLKTAIFDRQQISRIEVVLPRDKQNITFDYKVKKWNFLARVVRFGEVKYVHNIDPLAKKPDQTLWNPNVNPAIDQTFGGKFITDIVLGYDICKGTNLSMGINNLFDVYPDQIFQDPRNSLTAVYNDPTGAGYSSGRDASNRGRLLFNANQFGYNGRFMYARLGVDVDALVKGECIKRKPKPAPVVPIVKVVPKDTDGDGILDGDDACPTQAGPASLNGCPDRDGDGIADKDDACPDVPGPRIFNGCPDRDGDGIADKDDACPDVPGVAKYKGCPIPDRDKDGVADDEDRCPDQAGPASNSGCPVLDEVQKKMDIIARKVLFATGSAKLLESSHKALDEVATVMAENKDVKLDISGHTDNTGKADKNQALSDSRANAVMQYLVTKGVDASRMSAKGYGQTQPVADNKTAAGRQQNRRVELKLKY